jgi:hypothetical protein
MGSPSMTDNAKDNIKKKEGLPMSKNLKKRKICFKGKIVNIGIDMHKRFWQITVLVEGTILFAITMSKPDYPTFKKLLTQFDGNIVRVAYETGPCGFELFDVPIFPGPITNLIYYLY